VITDNIDGGLATGGAVMFMVPAAVAQSVIGCIALLVRVGLTGTTHVVVEYFRGSCLIGQRWRQFFTPPVYLNVSF
jgi:hypothetical protein